ncbi:MAG: hypothetical protein V4607_15095 [Pseudomonadota bacterium]
MTKSKASTLSSVWARPDNTVLMPKQLSVRLPALVAAKIAAICEMYPSVKRHEVINDLLATALEDFELGLDWEGVPGTEIRTQDGVFDYEQMEGPREDFRWLVVKHTKLIEKELGVTLSAPAAKNDAD